MNGKLRYIHTLLLAVGALWFSIITTSPALAEVYLEKDQALRLVFGEGCMPKYDPKPIDEALRDELEENDLWGEDHDKAHFFSCTSADGTTSYALIDEEIGKHLPITYIVGLSPQGTVTRVEMMVFREVRGWDVRERTFMAQFEGKQIGDPLAIGKTLRNVTGSTLSAKAMAKGVKRALVMWKHFYGQAS